MDKNAIKKFAVWARRELIARVSQKAEQYGITEEHHGDAYAERIGEQLLTRTEQNQRKNLITRIEQEGYKQVMEEVAYTWFNRFIALRFMEVNGYLPTRIRVFTDEENAFKPQILAEVIHMEMDGLDMEKVYAFKEKNQTEELFKYLIITQCNALSSILPGMFQTISDYTELLFPDNLLREGSVIQQMIELIPEEDWQDQVQIIGWLYQYYNTEPKDQVFANLKNSIKISKYDIPAVTQLFTPDWIVRYMVENSLGRLWMEGHPDEALQSTWKYYLPEAEQEPQVQAQLAEIRKEYANIKPEDIRCIDPCMGSGHILCYLFDVLVQIYKSYGYSTREAVQSIVENNLYGLDIDDRAAQLAYFAVMMKARQYDRRFFTRGIQPHVMAIQESNTLEAFDHLQRQLSLDTMCLETANQLIRTFRDAKEYGSILDVEISGLDTAERLMEQIRAINGDFELMAWIAEAEELLPVLAKQADIIQQKYDVVVTNPPYRKVSDCSEKLIAYVRRLYPDSKADLSTVFMEKCHALTNGKGLYAMINIPVWMTQSSFEVLRQTMLAQDTFVNMLHLGRGVFGSDFGTTAFVVRRGLMNQYAATYRRLFDGLTEVDLLSVKEKWFFEGKGIYTARQNMFDHIEGQPIAYWVTQGQLAAFDSPALSTYAEPRQGFATGANDLFLRLWHEVNITNAAFNCATRAEASASGKKWFPCNKGGAFRRWYGNNERFVNWQADGREMTEFSGSVIRNPSYYFREGMTWSTATMSKLSMRYSPKGFLFESKGSVCFPHEEKNVWYLLAYLNTKIVEKMLLVLAPTVDYHEGPLGRIPVIISDKYFDEVSSLSRACVERTKNEWDSFETSWDFSRHPLIRNKQALWDCTAVACTLASVGVKLADSMSPLEICYHLWEAGCYDSFEQLKSCEEELNRIFIDIYGLQDELSPEVDDKDITVRKADLGRDIRSLISYAVGCMFGRYSLDIPGLILAGQAFKSRFAHNPMGVAYGDPCQLEGDFISRIENDDDYVRCTFAPDRDGILPISDDEYFADDIVGKFVKFIEVVYGEESLEANLKFIADALSGKGSPREVIRSYFLNDFYADHLKIYQKRPIYWLFDSGKKNGFKCLIYMHRYAPDTIARIRTDYVHEQQSRYRTAIHDLENRIASASTGERVKLTKMLTKLRDQAEEARVYEEKIHHYADQMIAIDLDDGVKVNYAKFQDVLAKIK
ncbi:MAG: BREX-1 system adenine-specific DNA-methyltransferase PglX [bacterium]|nr:BREX-1 system adenine-specific DNA-methyltransferase PglX [bacterium]